MKIIPKKGYGFLETAWGNVTLNIPIDQSYARDDETTTIFKTHAQGNKVRYNPPRYKCEYVFNVIINVNSPWFSTIKFELTSFDRRPDSRYTDLFRDYERQADGLMRTLVPSLHGNSYYNNTNYNQNQQSQYNAQQRYQQQQSYSNEQHNMNYQSTMPQSRMWVCQHCGSQNTGKFCESCGSLQPQSMTNAYNGRAISYRCDKCGWTQSDPNNVPKFCPQCGDVFNENDIN